MRSAMKITQAMLVTDAAFLCCYGASSLLFVPGAPGEPYLSSGRISFGVLPVALGLASLACAVWLAFVQARESARQKSE